MLCDPSRLKPSALSIAVSIILKAVYRVDNVEVETILLNGLLADLLYEQEDRDCNRRWRLS